jgi:hypothetical protein
MYHMLLFQEEKNVLPEDDRIVTAETCRRVYTCNRAVVGFIKNCILSSPYLCRLFLPFVALSALTQNGLASCCSRTPSICIFASIDTPNLPTKQQVNNKTFQCVHLYVRERGNRVLIF